MNSGIKQQILEQIRAHECIILTRHARPDGDAVGSTMGLADVLRRAYPEKRIFLANEDRSEQMAFLGDEGPLPREEDYRDALIIVLDTATMERVANHMIKPEHTVVKIDHHVEETPFCPLSWVEDRRVSVSEMIVDFVQSFPGELSLSPKAAECLFAGIATDSGRFRYRGTTGETLRCAATLLDYGIDTETLYSHVYIEEYKDLKFHAEVLKRMHVTENGVAWVHIPIALREKLGISREAAGFAVSHLEGIKGSLIWIAFLDEEDGSVRARLRSRFVTIRELAMRYHGGGHDCASGATAYTKAEMRALLADADALLKEYKATHEDWI